MHVKPALALGMVRAPVNDVGPDFPQRRRLEDDIERIFHRACVTAELEAATDLLNLLEKWGAKRSSSYGRERRIDGARVQDAREALERLTRK